MFTKAVGWKGEDVERLLEVIKGSSRVGIPYSYSFASVLNSWTRVSRVAVYRSECVREGDHS